MERYRIGALFLFAIASTLFTSCRGGSHSGFLPHTGVPVHKQSTGDYAAAVQADQPVQYFQLTETSGPTATDSSATGVNGTYVGNVTFSASGPLLDESSTAISLPGGTASVGVSLPNPNAPAGTSYSMVTWVNPTLTNNYITIWGYNGTHRLLVSSTGKLLSQFSGNFSSNTLLTSGQWHQIAFVYNAQTSTESYYIDGALDNSATLSNSAAAFASTYYLGQYDAGAYYKWRGSIGQHAFFKTALTSGQIATLYSTAGYGGASPTPSPTNTPPPPTPTPAPSPSTPGNYSSTVLGNTPAQYFKLSESSGPTAFDSSTTAINGTYVGPVTFVAAGPLRNEPSTAISLPGGTASVGVSLPNPNATAGQSYSIATWVNPILPSQFMTIWGYNGTHRLLVNSSGHLLSQFTSAGFTSIGALTARQWHFVVFVYNAQTATQSYYIDGTLDTSAPLSNAAAAFTSAYYLGQYSTAPYYKWQGGLAQHAFFTSALTATQIANLYAAAGYGTSTPPPSVTPSYSDWNTYGDSLSGTNYNPNESTLSAANVSGLHVAWSADLGAAITAQPIVATNVSIAGTPTTVVYIGTEGGAFYALDAATGKTLWSNQLSTVTSACLDLPGGTFGITGTATYDKTRNLVYVADGHDQVHAFDMSSGTEAAGWPVTVLNSFTKDHIYSALIFNPANGLLYASTGSFCDQSAWHGTLVAIDTSSATITNTFVPATPNSGDGMWGIGGVAIDASNNVYVTTGNTIGGGADNAAYGDQVVQLTAQLQVISAAKPPLFSGNSDFGATPMLYQPGACPPLVVAKQKSGRVYTWNEANLAGGALQGLQMASAVPAGLFVGVTAYSPQTNLVYVGNPLGDVAPFTRGISALAVQQDCTLAVAWQQSVGPPATDDNNYSPTVANGVTYLTDGIGNQVFAYDAASGQQLWNSGGIIGGPVMSSPTVDGQLFVASWDHKVYAFSI